jgi:hypothetical protein
MPLGIRWAKGFGEGLDLLFCGYAATPVQVDANHRNHLDKIASGISMWWRCCAVAALVSVVSSAAIAQTPARFRVERQNVPGGAELLTVFGTLPDSATRTRDAEVPLISVLRDTLGDDDPDNDRLRYVWVLTAPRPTVLQRVAAATPFYYWRAGAGKGAGHRPAPVMDLSAPGSAVWKSLAGSVAQLVAFDPNGAVLRSATRSYRNNARDHRQLHLLEGLAILSQLDDIPGVSEALSEPEMLAIQARLALSARTFGGFVSDSNLPEAYINQRTSSTEDRGHNWELLRQRAEANGLYFEPFGLGDSPTQALLWVAKEDLGSGRAFDSQFLDIANPYDDARLKNWTGFTKSFKNGDGPSRELIPLALYALGHPKTPLLLVDFRDTRAPKHREMLRHATVDVVSGVIGFSKWGNLPYMAGSWTWNFVRARHGAPNDRLARIKAYSETRQWLALDPSLEPEFRDELLRRLQVLGVNPLEDNVFDEAKFAQRQYDALLTYATDPQGLEARLERDRNAEMTRYEHGFAARAGLRTLRVVTLGAYTHHEDETALVIAGVNRERRATLTSIRAVGGRLTGGKAANGALK